MGWVKMADFSIRDILHKVSSGIIRIPTFQRGFVWDAETIAFFMDSIYKGYPVGTLQLWRTHTQLETEKKLGPFTIFSRDDQFPIDYVLDGQQRITSIFGVFQTDIPISEDEENPFNIYFDLKADVNIQDSQFLSLESGEVNPVRHFPLNCLFDTVKYRQATSELPDEDVNTIDLLQSIFKEVKIPYQTLETEDNGKVAIVFERINRKGIPLDMYQLLSAWTWSQDFTLQTKFEELADELKPYGFEDVGENINLLLRICSAILSASGLVNNLINLNGQVVRDRFDEVQNGIKGAIDFLKTNLKVEKIDNLPYDNLLIPLSAFFSCEGNRHFNYNSTQRKEILKWFWRTCFSKKYSAGTIRAIDRDIEEINKLKNGQISNLSSVTVNIDKDYFLKNKFALGNVNTKTHILMLAQNSPRSFISGSLVTLDSVLKDYNRNEFHHIYPKGYLKTLPDLAIHEAVLANFCFLSRADNKTLGGVAPSRYRQQMPSNAREILYTHHIDEQLLFADDYIAFVEDRALRLLAASKELINQ